LAILAGIFAVVVNRVFCLLLLRTEKRLAEKGVISQRGEILYLEDYNFFKWGDNWFLSLMDFAIAFVLVERWPLPALWTLLLCLLVESIRISRAEPVLEDKPLSRYSR